MLPDASVTAHFVMEDGMPDHRSGHRPDYHVESSYAQPMAAVFTALVNELGQERWLRNADRSAATEPPRAGLPRAGLPRVGLPRAGLKFGYRQAQRFYSGQVLECIRPVSIVIVERYTGPAGSIVARQRWRVNPLDMATQLSGRLQLETNRFARLQWRFWSAHFRSRVKRTCSRVGKMLSCATVDDRAATSGTAARGELYSGSIGQRNGSISMVNANTISVNGKPILR
jgi:hypothetical protein